MNQNEMKKAAAVHAVDKFVKSGMKVGLGTGSTAIHAVYEIASRLEDGRLKDILAVSTSYQTSIEAERLGIPLATIGDRRIAGELDLAIDGADEVDENNLLTKGGGGALWLEKVIAYSAKQFVVIVDQSKLVKNIGHTFPVPVEILPAALIPVTMGLQKLGAKPELRMAVKKAGPVVTDNGMLLLDCVFPPISNPSETEIKINSIPGVAENGIFGKKGFRIVCARNDGTILDR
jgi:ribose 5-phosphate isomerase A